MPRVFIKTYGCQMNVRDSEQVAQMFEERGYTMTPQETEADVILINTCSVRDQAEQKALGKMGNMGKYREKTPVKVGDVGSNVFNCWSAALKPLLIHAERLDEITTIGGSVRGVAMRLVQSRTIKENGWGTTTLR